MEADTVPAWLWRLVLAGLVGLLVAIVALAAALALGAADPHPLGPLAWETDFNLRPQDGTSGWSLAVAGAASAAYGPEGLTLALQSGDATALLTQPVAGPPFTFEAAGAQLAGPSGAAYGIVFDYRSETEYSAVVLNNNGFLAAYRLMGDVREYWFAWQQWPHILLGAQANRLRVDIRDSVGEIRINQEVLLCAPATGRGAVGVIAHAQGGAQLVRFGWARLWQPGP